MKTGFYSFRIGLAKYIIPIVFVYDPGMLFEGGPFEIGMSIFRCFCGIFMLTIATEGFLYKPVGFIGRILAVAWSFLIFFPSLNADIVGFTGAILMIAFYRIRRDKEVVS